MQGAASSLSAVGVTGWRRGAARGSAGYRHVSAMMLAFALLTRAHRPADGPPVEKKHTRRDV